MALFHERRDLFKLLRREPSLVPQLPPGVLVHWSRVPQGVGERTLEQLMPAILEKFQTRENKGTGFEDFLNGLLQTYPTVPELRAFLRQDVR